MKLNEQQKVGAPEKPLVGALAYRLKALYETMAPSRGAVTDVVVAEGVFLKTVVEVSVSYLSLLCAGRQTNPSNQNVRAIAEYFAAPKSCLVDAGSKTRLGLR